MKTSFKMLLGLLLILIAAMLATAVSLRKQYDSIDKNDQYSRWKSIPLPAFRAVKLIGPTRTDLWIQPGKTTRLLIDTLKIDEPPVYTYRVAGDTLYVTLALEEGQRFPYEKYDDDKPSGARMVIEAPTLTGVTTVNANCQLTNYKAGSLTVRQTGQGGYTLLESVSLDQLTATLSGKNQLTITHTGNRIGQATIALADSARLHQYSDFERGLSLTAAAGASLRLTGKAMAQLRK